MKDGNMLYGSYWLHLKVHSSLPVTFLLIFLL